VNYLDQAKNTSLLAGFSTIFYVSFPATALYFLGYDGTRHYLNKFAPGLSPHATSMAGGLVAELLSNSFRNPFEVVKQQMQVGLDSSVGQTCKSIHISKGFLGFYAGFSSLILREVPYSVIQMPVYEMLKKATSRRTGKTVDQFSFFENFINGGIAGGISGLLTNPIDVVKTRLMTDRQRSLGIVACAKEIYHDEGIKGYSRGMLVRTLSCSLITAVLFVSYERIKAKINAYLGNESSLARQ
jgi:solute carrier family 25 S-adenosylmethionine transporter 26